MSNVDHPGYYNTGGIEVIDAIEAWGLGFNLGNAVKYIARCAHKGNRVEDLEKAVWYLNREILNTSKADGVVDKADHDSSVVSVGHCYCSGCELERVTAFIPSKGLCIFCVARECEQSGATPDHTPCAFCDKVISGFATYTFDSSAFHDRKGSGPLVRPLCFTCYKSLHDEAERTQHGAVKRNG